MRRLRWCTGAPPPPATPFQSVFGPPNFVFRHSSSIGGGGTRRTSCPRKHSEAGGGRPGCGGDWQQRPYNDPRNNQHNPQYANYWAPLRRQRHHKAHRPRGPTESSDPTQHAEGRTGDCPGPRKDNATECHTGGGRRGFTSIAPPPRPPPPVQSANVLQSLKGMGLDEGKARAASGQRMAVPVAEGQHSPLSCAVLFWTCVRLLSQRCGSQVVRSDGVLFVGHAECRTTSGGGCGRTASRLQGPRGGRSIRTFPGDCALWMRWFCLWPWWWC